MKKKYKNTLVYEVRNLEEARNFLSSEKGKFVLTTPSGSVKYYGILVIDQMLKALSIEFPEKVVDIIADVGDDHPALFTAIKLGYNNIVYTGDSKEAKGLFCKTKTVIASDL
ncbi:hypothetical protein RFEPED_1597 [Rickettsia felis str. Pedreira]|uniref:Uncharacterized protein n=2 Tax=Rickettsia felis TaxID=42862 RepID=A0A0F3MU49_RICFI|nr:hypothetical protein [Rickettsia felis]AAY61718.1 unknown [Rickettsia felis URRWXCal2]KHO03037.1 hypothetical protein JS55_04920 [Rickettsia felis str. LSU]KHO03487.1 hypothetical protein JS61_04825 [Rickettsia felis]KJV59196.1 hypothetical protein RFEPED_1597 [Rickettsia felis str. Pedreira]MDE8611641.1 hypothetical protein [Rickettsia felis]